MTRRIVTYLVALVCAAFAGTGVLWLTRAPGPGLSPDSMSYLGAARSLASGQGPRVPFADADDGDSTSRLRDYPPGYPLAIAAGIRLGATAEQAARGVMTIAAAVSVFGVALIAGSAAGPLAGAMAAAAVMIAPAFVEQHYIVLSEPLFLALLVLLLGLMTAGRTRAPALGLVSGAAVMVRYAGVALPLAAAIWCVSRPGTWRARLMRGAVAALPGAAAFVLWSRWAGGVREYGWKGHLWPTVVEGWQTLQGWLVPGAGASVLRSAVTLLLLAGAAWLLAAPSHRVLAASGLLAACYAAIVLVSRLTADSAIPFDNRLLSPLFLLATIAIVVAGAVRWPAATAPRRAAALAVVALWLAGSVAVVAREARELSEDGWGYASADWTGSDLARWLNGEGRQYVLFSDNPPSLYSLTRRPSRRLEEPGGPAADSAVSAARTWVALGSQQSAIVGFRDTESGQHGRTAALAAWVGHREVLRSDEGVVWVRYRPRCATPNADAAGRSAGFAPACSRPR